MTDEKPPERDPASLAEVLRTAHLIGEGSSAQVFRTDSGDAIKLFRAGVSAGMVEREFAAAALAAAHGVRVAAPIERAIHYGRELIRYRLVPGPTLLTVIGRKPWLALPSMYRLARVHALIHQPPVPGGLRAQSQVLARDIQHSPADAPTRAAAAAVLAASHRASRLCHGDLHPGNVIDSAGGLTVIDWSKASIGHPAADVARTELLLRFAPLAGPVARISLVKFGRWLAAMCYVRSYLWHAGMARADVLAWHLPVAVGWLRFRSGRPGDAFERYIAKLVARR